MLVACNQIEKLSALTMTFFLRVIDPATPGETPSEKRTTSVRVPRDIERTVRGASEVAGGQTPRARRQCAA